MCDHAPAFDHEAHLEWSWELGMMEPDAPARRGALPPNHPDSYENVQGRIGEIAVCTALSNAGIPHLDDVYLPWGKDGFTQIDHVALVGSTFVAVETKNWKGIMMRDVEGGEIYRIVKGVRIPLGDPTLQNKVHILALREFLRGATVTGIVVLPSIKEHEKFLDHLPNGYTRLPEAGHDIHALGVGTEPDAASLACWNLLEMFHSDEAYVSEARRTHAAKYDPNGVDPAVTEAWKQARAARLVAARHFYRGGPPPPFKNPFRDDDASAP